MTTPINARRDAYISQNHRCFYCSAPMWLRKPSKFQSRFHLSSKDVSLFKCTAEHLLARCDGGTNARSNIAAACLYCNRTRHQTKKPLDPSGYKAEVMKHVESGAWMTAVILRSPKIQIG